MSFALSLPTTSRLDLTEYFTSNSHPSLPSVATKYRNVLRNTLKIYKKLPPTSQPHYVVNVNSAVGDYLPYILTISNGIKHSDAAGEKLVVQENHVLKSEWRSPMTSGFSGRVSPKLKFVGLEFEVAYVFSVKATCHYLQAKFQLQPLLENKPLADDQRNASIAGAVKCLLDANAAYNWLSRFTSQILFQKSLPDLSSSTFEALARLSLAEATLTTVLKDDPYPALVAQARNSNDREWMIKPPNIPQVRAHVLSRLSLAAVEHIRVGQSLLVAHKPKLDEALLVYFDDLRCVARAKACRFLGIHAELSGRVGESIAWLQAANREAGISNVTRPNENKIVDFTKWKLERAEKKEEKRISKGGDSNGDVRNWEERRIIDTLMKKWSKLNDTVHFEEIPSPEQLIQNLPSGRDIYTPKAMTIPTLGLPVLVELRANPDTPALDLQQDECVSSDGEEISPNSQYY